MVMVMVSCDSEMALHPVEHVIARLLRNKGGAQGARLAQQHSTTGGVDMPEDLSMHTSGVVSADQRMLGLFQATLTKLLYEGLSIMPHPFTAWSLH